VTPPIPVVPPQPTLVPVPLPEMNVFYKEVLPEAKIKITNSNIYFVVTDAHFKFNSAKLNPSGKKRVAEYTKFLIQNPDLSVTIEGHTDRRGEKRYNNQLGLRRAKAVWNEMKRHLVRNQMEVVSYGEDRPIDPARTEAAYAKNRRVEIHVNKGKHYRRKTDE
jgi:peptidoglycan-associated lipoprotein